MSSNAKSEMNLPLNYSFICHKIHKKQNLNREKKKKAIVSFLFFNILKY